MKCRQRCAGGGHYGWLRCALSTAARRPETHQHADRSRAPGPWTSAARRFTCARRCRTRSSASPRQARPTRPRPPRPAAPAGRRVLSFARIPARSGARPPGRGVSLQQRLRDVELAGQVAGAGVDAVSRKEGDGQLKDLLFAVLGRQTAARSATCRVFRPGLCALAPGRQRGVRVMSDASGFPPC